MRLFLITICLVWTTIGSAQDVTEQIYSLYESGAYKEVIETYADRGEELSYKGLFHLGLSYYKSGKDKMAIVIMDQCISKNEADSGPHYIKGKSLNFTRQFAKAAKAFDKAIDIDGGNGSYYTGLGDAYMSMSQLDKALMAYQSAIEYEDCPERPYRKIPLILSAAGKTQAALVAYYLAKEKIDRSGDAYPSILYKIGIHESMNQNHNNAKLILDELVDIDPSYYQAYPILIQSNIGLKNLDQVEALKDKLYAAYDKGLLKHGLREKFCFEQFTWDNKIAVKAYERFESDKDKVYLKHIYEVKENSLPLYSIQTMHLPDSAKPYILQKSDGTEEFTYAAVFDRNCKYEELKTEVINIITEKVQPVQ